MALTLKLLSYVLRLFGHHNPIELHMLFQYIEFQLTLSNISISAVIYYSDFLHIFFIQFISSVTPVSLLTLLSP